MVDEDYNPQLTQRGKNSSQSLNFQNSSLNSRVSILRHPAGAVRAMQSADTGSQHLGNRAGQHTVHWSSSSAAELGVPKPEDDASPSSLHKV